MLLLNFFIYLTEDHGEQYKNSLCIIASFLLFLTIEKMTSLLPNTRALGTLNLIANFFDNSMHGTTVVGEFQVSTTVKKSLKNKIF